MDKIIAYHGNSDLKIKLLEKIEWHRQQAAIISGTYGGKRDGKFVGCAVGCSVRSLDEIEGKANGIDGNWSSGIHARMSSRLGIPVELCRLEDVLFERLPESGPHGKVRELWPGRFAAAITPGADLSLVWTKWCVRTLTRAKAAQADDLLELLKGAPVLPVKAVA